MEKLGGDNFAKWRDEINLILVMMDKDHSMREPTPVALVAAPATAGKEDATLADRTAAYLRDKKLWERSDRVALTIMDIAISPTIRGSLEKPKNAKDFMEKIEEYFKGSAKANAMILMSKLMSMKYNGHGSVREHILGMIDLQDKLKDLDCPLNDVTLLHHVMLSLASVFEPFKISYNTSDQKWDIIMLIAKCSQEEERIRS
jgi:hypothetical protein